MIRRTTVTLVLGGLALFSGTVRGDITITQGASAPTYSTTLNFDEPGQATGSVPQNYWSASHGISNFAAGTGDPGVGNLFGTMPWLGDSNIVEGPFGLFINFANDLSELSFNAWDNSGPPTLFGGGMGVFVFNDGGVDPIAGTVYNPAFGGLGDPAFNITTSGGMVFDEVRILGFGFTPVTWGDNFSWNVVPEPGSAALVVIGMLGLLSRRRR